jgi:hypothetical protein
MADSRAACRADAPSRRQPASPAGVRPPRLLSARSARTLYNVADALVPPGPEGAPGGGDVDLVPWLEGRLRRDGPAVARRLGALLLCLEWHPVATLRAPRPFSRLPRSRRRALLARWERSRLAVRRRALASLRATIEEGVAAHSSEGA